MNISAALRSVRTAKSLTGLTPSEFWNLVPLFENNFLEQRIKFLSNRQRRVGGGRKGHLATSADKLFAALLYLKTYPTFDVLGFMLNMEKTRACRNIHLLLPVLEKTLGRQLVLPKRQIRSMEEFLTLFPQVKDVFIDGTDRRVQRPKNPKKQNKLYSGKRKTTTRKNIIVADEKRQVLFLSPTKSGRRHDKRLLDKIGVGNIPPEVTTWTDTGFTGLAKTHPNIQMPVKGTKKKPLTQNERENNKLISHFRVKVEHAICGIKRLRAVTDVYRNHKPNFDDTLMLLSTGIWNYHLQMAPVLKGK